MVFVIQYNDGLYNSGYGFLARLEEATRYATLEEAKKECEHLMYHAKVIPDPSELKNL